MEIAHHPAIFEISGYIEITLNPEDADLEPILQVSIGGRSQFPYSITVLHLFYDYDVDLNKWPPPRVSAYGHRILKSGHLSDVQTAILAERRPTDEPEGWPPDLLAIIDHVTPQTTHLITTHVIVPDPALRKAEITDFA